MGAKRMEEGGGGPPLFRLLRVGPVLTPAPLAPTAAYVGLHFLLVLLSSSSSLLVAYKAMLSHTQNQERKLMTDEDGPTVSRSVES